MTSIAMHFGSVPGRKREFVRLLEAEWEDCNEITVDLRAAARLLWRNALESPALEAAIEEVNERSKGMPYRLETSIGPLFAQQSLWRHAGRPGGHLSDDITVFSTVERKDRPSWDGDYRPIPKDVAKRVIEAWRKRKAAEEREAAPVRRAA